jgi:glycosyltransferase involved in cell wall biosynthesis
MNDPIHHTPVTRVSVIIPTRNRAQLLSQAVRSAQAATRPSLEVEVVVVDDGSTDETAAVAASLGVTLIAGPRTGPSAARNAGLRASSGELVTFLDDDDVLVTDRWVELVESLRDHPAWAAACGRVVLTSEELQPTSPPYPERALRTGALFEAFLSYIPQVGTLVVRRAVLDDVGGFDESLQGGEDWDWALRLARGRTVGALASVVLFWRMHASPRADGAGNTRTEDIIWRRYLDVMDVAQRHLAGAPLGRLKSSSLMRKHRGHYTLLFYKEAALYQSRGHYFSATYCRWLAFRASPLHSLYWLARRLRA